MPGKDRDKFRESLSFPELCCHTMAFPGGKAPQSGDEVEGMLSRNFRQNRLPPGGSCHEVTVGERGRKRLFLSESSQT